MVTEQRRETAVAVVVVDDEESIREGCRQTLDAQGYRTSVAEDGLKGLRMVEQVKPGVVLVDLKMPGMDGLEVLKRIRQIDPHVAMIVITGYATVESAVTAMKIGACDYLNKPFKTEKLLSVVAEGVERNRLGKRVASLESERKQALNNFAADVTVVERPKAFEVATKVLTARGLASFVERMIADRSVIGVRTKEPTEDHFVFASLEGASQLRLDYDVTILPPKKYLLPPCEVLVEFELGGDPKARPRVEAGAPTVLIGVHPYDMIAINQLDVLMSQTNPDPNYLARRGMLTIIGVDPVRASKKAFWGGMGCDVVENGFDLWLTDIGGAYVVEVDSEKGAALLDKYTEAQDATEEQLQARSKARAKAKEFGSTRQLDFRPAELPGLLRRFFDHGVWAKQALHAENLQSHVLHVGYLALPDLAGVGSVIPLASSHPEEVKTVIRLHRMANEMSDLVCGRTTHPQRLVPGGFTRIPSETDLLTLKDRLGKAVPDLQAVAELVKALVGNFPAFQRETEYIALVGQEEYPFYDGQVGSTDGGGWPASAYRQITNEYVVPHSTAKHAKHKRDSYMVGALARFNLNTELLLPIAKQVADLFGLKAINYNPFMNNVAQLVECFQSAEDSIRLIDEILQDGLKAEKFKVEPKAGKGVSAVEVPRGILFHDYEYDEQGRCVNANMVIPTNQNHANIQLDMEALLPAVTGNGNGREQIEHILEMLVRAYDPCVSCSTHLLKVRFEQ
ncbi:MAG: response regulator [Planctomycetes bacterium]|nr:response regulator [Planctomycetota bacterium]